MATKRSPYDFYPTPKDVIDKLLNNYGNLEGKSIIEPCAGNGQIIKALKERLYTSYIAAYEIDESHKEELSNIGADEVFFEDFLATDTATAKVDYIITNPPFSLAQEFIEHSFKRAKKVIMLLRLNFLGSQKRHDFWLKYPPDQIMVLSKRPSFTGTGTDSQEYAWFVWDGEKHNTPITVI